MNGTMPAGNRTGLFRRGERLRLRFDVRIPGLKLRVVAADGQDVEAVSVDEFRLGTAEVLDVIVAPDADRAYTVFAQSIDRTGYARGTLAPQPWWDVQLGAREDFGHGPARSWAGLGVEGLAPPWLDLEATVYLGEQARTAARLKAEYDILITQRLIVQPEAQANLYGKSDPARQVGSGLSELDAGIRARYEIRRELAPYVGVAWRRLFGATAGFARTLGQSASDVQFLAGIRIWF
jgi:hypothetical protein